MLAAMHGLIAGHGRVADLSVREIFMADSVRWHLQHAVPGTRIVLAAHNNHIQKTPLSFDGVLTALPMGQHLHRMLGSDYRAVALTHTVRRMHYKGSVDIEASPDQVWAALIDIDHTAGAAVSPWNSTRPARWLSWSRCSSAR